MIEKGEKEFRNRASPLESRYPNKYEDNDNDDACCARNRLELIQFPFLFSLSPFFHLPRGVSSSSSSLISFSLLKSLDSTFFILPFLCIKPSLLFILLLVTPLSSRASYACCERFLPLNLSRLDF